MYKFSRHSKEQLGTVHALLKLALKISIKFVDFKVLEGFRDERRQNELYEDGKSNVRWPDSKHNESPSMAVDIAPYPVDWSDTERFYYVAGFIMGVGSMLLRVLRLRDRYAFRYGGDWDRDGDISDQSFNDLGHIELVRLD